MRDESAVVALAVVAAVGNAAPDATRRSDGPVWAGEVPAAVAASDGDPAKVVDVRTAPWPAKLLCSRLLSTP